MCVATFTWSGHCWEELRTVPFRNMQGRTLERYTFHLWFSDNVWKLWNLRLSVPTRMHGISSSRYITLFCKHRTWSTRQRAVANKKGLLCEGSSRFPKNTDGTFISDHASVSWTSAPYLPVYNCISHATELPLWLLGACFANKHLIASWKGRNDAIKQIDRFHHYELREPRYVKGDLRHREWVNQFETNIMTVLEYGSSVWAACGCSNSRKACTSVLKRIKGKVLDVVSCSHAR